jgi:hypothetical protein
MLGCLRGLLLLLAAAVMLQVVMMGISLRGDLHGDLPALDELHNMPFSFMSMSKHCYRSTSDA